MTEANKKPVRTRTKPTQQREELPPEKDRGPGIAGNPNKYAQRPKIGTPTLGKSPNYVETVGLGNLKVISANGNVDV